MKRILFGIMVILIIVIGFLVNALVQQSKGYNQGLISLEKHYNESQYKESLSIYLNNHFKSKQEFQFRKSFQDNEPFIIRDKECFEYGINSDLINGVWAEGDEPFCESNYSFVCMHGETKIEGFVDESKNNCENTIIINCICWY